MTKGEILQQYESLKSSYTQEPRELFFDTILGIINKTYSNDLELSGLKKENDEVFLFFKCEINESKFVIATVSEQDTMVLQHFAENNQYRKKDSKVYEGSYFLCEN